MTSSKIGSLLDAFGIYSNYRGTNIKEISIGAEGYLSSTQLIFYQDKYFVRIQATGTTGLENDTLLAFGQALSRNLPPNTARPKELDVMEMPDIIPNSERYIPQSILGYAFFRRGLIADVL